MCGARHVRDHAAGEVQVDHRPAMVVAVLTRTLRAAPASGLAGPRSRVLVLPAWYPWPDRPGLGTFCRDQADAVSLLHDVVVITWRRDTGLSRPFVVSELTEDGLRTFRIQVRPQRRPRLETLVTTLAVLSVLARLIVTGWRADIVHAHEFQVGIPGVVAAAISRAPLIVSEHWSLLALGQLPPGEAARARRFFRRAAVVSPVSHDMAQRIAPLVDASKLKPVPNPVDTRVFVPATRRRSAAIRLLSVGNLTAIKGHFVLIEAMARVVATHPTVHLDIVGDGELRADLERQARERGITSHLRFHGRLARHRVAEMMRAADVFVLPSLWENLPCVLLEAMSSGLPVVASRVGGTAEIVDASTGRLAEPDSAAALADAIVRVIADRDRFDPQLMHQRADAQYSYRAVARMWTETYGAAIRGRRSVPRWFG